jgi:hypothetical protein
MFDRNNCLSVDTLPKLRSVSRLVIMAGAVVLLGGCETLQTLPVAGSPQYTGAIVSRGYDCGLRVDRGRIIALESGYRRTDAVLAGQYYAVAAYRAPKVCDAGERAFVSAELKRLASERR